MVRRRCRRHVQAGLQAIKNGTVLILSDRGVDEKWGADSGLLGISAIHQHLIRECTRTEVGLILETEAACPSVRLLDRLRRRDDQSVPRVESLVDMERDNHLPEGSMRRRQKVNSSRRSTRVCSIFRRWAFPPRSLLWCTDL